MIHTESATFQGTGQRSGKPERPYKQGYDNILGRIQISGFGTPFYQLMSDPNNVTLEQEMRILAEMPVARRFCIENYPRSDVVPSIGLMYGEKGVSLIYQPDMSRTWQAKGMIYDKRAKIWLPDLQLFDKDSSEKGKYIEKSTGKEAKVFLPNEWDFPDYNYNQHWAVPYKSDTHSLLDVFDIENHGFPKEFVKDFEEAKKEYIKDGLDEDLGEGWERCIFRFWRLDNSKRDYTYAVWRDLDIGFSDLDADRDSSSRVSNAGGRFSSGS